MKVIGRPGVGVDNVDLQTATDKKIVVMNTPLGNVQATSELTMGIIHSLLRKIHLANQSMHNKKWEKKNFVGSELLGRTIGIVGFGNIGKKISEFSHAYGMKVIVNSSSLKEDEEKKYIKQIINTFRIDDLLYQYNVDLIIGDVEGHEPEILMGATNTLPLDLRGLTTTVTTPIIYALGTVTTSISSNSS